MPLELRGVRRVMRRLSVGLVAVILSSCAAVAPGKPEDVVKRRAQERWDAMVKSDFEAAYRYMSPGSRSVMTAPEFIASVRSGFWKSAVVEKVECGSAQSCEVNATIEYEHLGRRTKTPLRETWIREGQDWWYLRK